MKLARSRALAAIGPIAMLCSLGSLPVLAQDDTIVVEAMREADPEEVRSQAHAITPRAGSLGEPLARFHQPICAGVWGLSPDSAQLIIDRIYYNAERFGVAVNDTPGCKANLVAIFIADAHSQFADLRKGNHRLVEGLDLWERKRVADQDGVALAWNAVSTLTRDGQGRLGNPPVFDTTQASRLETAIMRAINISVVMIDARAIAGKDGVAVADYVTMRALAQTRIPAPQDTSYDTSYDTILSLFDESRQAPAQLTDFDRAYLASLYAGRANRPDNQALRNIARLMVEGSEKGR